MSSVKRAKTESKEVEAYVQIDEALNGDKAKAERHKVLWDMLAPMPNDLLYIIEGYVDVLHVCCNKKAVSVGTIDLDVDDLKDADVLVSGNSIFLACRDVEQGGITVRKYSVEPLGEGKRKEQSLMFTLGMDYSKWVRPGAGEWEVEILADDPALDLLLLLLVAPNCSHWLQAISRNTGRPIGQKARLGDIIRRPVYIGHGYVLHDGLDDKDPIRVPAEEKLEHTWHATVRDFHNALLPSFHVPIISTREVEPTLLAVARDRVYVFEVDAKESALLVDVCDPTTPVAPRDGKPPGVLAKRRIARSTAVVCQPKGKELLSAYAVQGSTSRVLLLSRLGRIDADDREDDVCNSHLCLLEIGNNSVSCLWQMRWHGGSIDQPAHNHRFVQAGQQFIMHGWHYKGSDGMDFFEDTEKNWRHRFHREEEKDDGIKHLPRMGAQCSGPILEAVKRGTNLEVNIVAIVSP